MLPILDLKPFGWETIVNIQKTGAKGATCAQIPACF